MSRNRVIYCGFGTYKDRPPPLLGGFVTGTRMVIESPLFDHTDFHLSVYTHKDEGGYAGRFIEDVRRFRESLRENPQHETVMMQCGQYRSIYREWLIGRMAKWAGRKLVVDVRAGSVLDFLDRDSNAVERELFRRLMHLGDLVLVQCQSFLPELRKRHPGVRFEWLPNFVPESRARDRTAPPFAAGQRLKLVYFGYYIPEKGIRQMLEAVRRCREEQALDVELHLAGEPHDPELARLVRAAADHGVIDHGRMQPADLWDMLGEMHVLLYPTSHWGEGHTNAVNEALMNGLVIVATRHHELPWVLPADDTRWLDADRLVDSLVEHIAQLAADPDEVNRLSRASQAWLREKYLDTRWIPFLEREFDALRGAGRSELSGRERTAG